MRNEAVAAKELVPLADLLSETFDEGCQGVWANERTPIPILRLGVRFHTAGLSVRETVAILDLLGVDRSHGAVWNWVHTVAEPRAKRNKPRSTANTD